MRAQVDLANTLKQQSEAKMKALAKKKAQKSEEEDVLEIMKKQQKEDED